MQGYNMWQQMVSETEEVCALNVTKVFMVSSTGRGGWLPDPAHMRYSTGTCK